MKNLLLLVASFLLCSVAVHVESVGKCTVSETESHYQYTFVLSKENVRNLHPSLENFKGGVEDMLLLKTQILEGLQVEVNDVPVEIELDKSSSSNRFVVLSFTSKKTKELKSIRFKNTGFLLLKSHHASFDFWLNLNNKRRLFKLNPSRKTFKALYK